MNGWLAPRPSARAEGSWVTTRAKAISALLSPTPSTQLFAALGSLRDVEPMAMLILDDFGMAPRPVQGRTDTVGSGSLGPDVVGAEDASPEDGKTPGGLR